MKITFYYAPKNGLDEKLKVYNDLLGKLRNASNEDEYDSICCDVADADPYTELETFTNGFGLYSTFLIQILKVVMVMPTLKKQKPLN